MSGLCILLSGIFMLFMLFMCMFILLNLFVKLMGWFIFGIGGLFKLIGGIFGLFNCNICGEGINGIGGFIKGDTGGEGEDRCGLFGLKCNVGSPGMPGMGGIPGIWAKLGRLAMLGEGMPLNGGFILAKLGRFGILVRFGGGGLAAGNGGTNMLGGDETNCGDVEVEAFILVGPICGDNCGIPPIPPNIGFIPPIPPKGKNVGIM